jgi:hypothetical protein
MKHLPGVGRRAIRWLGVLAIAAAAMLVAPATPASAAQPYPAVGSIISIYNNHSQRCLDADLYTLGTNGTRVQLWNCNGQAQQRWRVLEGYASYTRVLQNVASGKCLDEDLNTRGRNGAIVQLWDCNYNYNQNWIIGGGNEIQNRDLANNNPVLYLDADLNTINGNGTRVQLWTYNGALHQGWHYG